MFVVQLQKTECGWGRMDFITVKGTLLLHANQTGTSLYVWWPKQVLFISSFNEMMSCTNRFVTAYFTKVTLHNEKKQNKKKQILVEAENLLTAKPVWPERIYLIQCEVPSPLLHICCHALGGQHHSKWAGN